MTSIFAFPLSNAWVIVGDKLESDGHETIRIEKGYEIFPSQLSSKIEKQGKWILGFSGDSKQIKNQIKPVFYSHLNINMEFKNICKEIKSLFSKLSDIDVSAILFDIKNNKCYHIIFSELSDDNLNNYEVNKIEEGFIGSGLNMCRGNAVLASLVELQSYKLKRKPDSIIKTSVSVLNNISILDYHYTGSPYIYGCDIFIIKNGLAKKYEIIPNGYLFKEENKDWRLIER